jgi:hypothetical protein
MDDFVEDVLDTFGHFDRGLCVHFVHNEII